jgi:hypothetical protein
MNQNGYVLGLCQNHKGNFISSLYALMNLNKIPELFEIEVEIFDPDYLESQLHQNYNVFVHLIGSQKKQKP